MRVLYLFSRSNFENFDIPHAFLGLTITKLSSLKSPGFLAHPVHSMMIILMHSYVKVSSWQFFTRCFCVPKSLGFGTQKHQMWKNGEAILCDEWRALEVSLGHIDAKHVVRSVVWQLGTRVYCAKTGEPIEMPFEGRLVYLEPLYFVHKQGLLHCFCQFPKMTVYSMLYTACLKAVRKQCAGCRWLNNIVKLYYEDTICWPTCNKRRVFVDDLILDVVGYTYSTRVSRECIPYLCQAVA